MNAAAAIFLSEGRDIRGTRPLSRSTLLLACVLFACSSSETPDPSDQPGGSGGAGSNAETGGAGPQGSGGAEGTGATSSSGGAGAGQGTGGQAAGGHGSGGLDGSSSGGSSSGGAGPASGGSGPDAIDTAVLVPDMGFGTNIGNTLENTTIWETGWGQPLITEQFINGLAANGIGTVRVPVAWDTYASGGMINAANTARVKEVVSWIEAAGMYAIVNIHWDGGWIFNESTEEEPNPNQYLLTDDVKTKFASYWTQIASEFSDVGHRLIFEGLNEEGRYYINQDDQGQPNYASLNELNQLFVDTVRAQAGFNKTRALVYAGFQTDIERTCVAEFQAPDDPAGPGKMLLSLHYYTPYTFTLMDTVETWGMPSTTWGTSEETAEHERLFDLAASCGASRGTPILLGEFASATGENFVRDTASRILWLEAVVGGAYSRGMVPVLWDTGAEISRADASFSGVLQTVLDNVATN